ncbi:MAG: family peptidase, partial [Candidatus Poribacteria bacterium]|nr:family peptidase [Candidatus Poribacteria bacterium]
MYRVAVSAFTHETNTFAIEQNDSMDCVHIQHTLINQASKRSCIGGFTEVMVKSDVELIPTLGISFSQGGIIHAGIYEQCRDMILDALQKALPLDAIYLDLHGAMVAKDPYNDAEGKLIELIRNAFGNIPIVGTYDFHAIMSERELELIVPFPYNTNPHIDGYERGIEAGKCLYEMLIKSIQPVTRRIFVPILGPNIGQSTWSHDPEVQKRLLLYQLNQKREELEKKPGVINISILGGYGYADSPDTGMSVIATTYDDSELANQLAMHLAMELWERRGELETVRPIYSIDMGVKMAMDSDEFPVLLVDLGDDPGSACPADSPAVLESLIRHGARDCALTIRDDEVVRAGISAGVGATLNIPVGGKIDQRFYKPLKINGIVKSIDDGRYMVCGPTHGGWGSEVKRENYHEVDVGKRVVLRIGQNIDVIFSQKQTGKDRDFFKSAG